MFDMKISKYVMVMLILSFIATTISGCTNSNIATVVDKDAPYEISWLEQCDPTLPYDANKDVHKKAIEEALNIKINPEFVEYSQYNQKLSLKIASGETPDIVNRVSQASDYIKYSRNGIFFDMTDLLNEKDAPNLYPSLSQELWNQAKVDGRIYGVPFIFGLGKGYRYNTVLRKDYLEQIGADMPKTLDEYYNILLEVKKQFPDVIPLGAVSSTGISEFAIRSFDHVFGAFEVQPGYFYQKDGKFSNYDIDPRMREALLFLQKMYAEDLIDKEFLTIKETSFKDKLFSGKVFSFVTQWANPASWDLTIEQNILKSKGDTTELTAERLNDEFQYLQPMGSLVGKNGTAVAGAGGAFDTLIAISAATKDPHKLFAILDKAHEKNMIRFFTHGIEGEDYVVNEDGSIEAGPLSTIDPITRTDKNGNYREKGRYQIITQQNGSPTWRTDMNYRLTYSAVLAVDNPYQITCASNYLESATKTERMSELYTIRDAAFSKIIMGADISTFDTFVEQWLNQGGRAILQELEESYRANN